ncbi:MAG: hypothetical protein ACR2QL_12505 [Woeseiaceae bacterium]
MDDLAKKLQADAEQIEVSISPLLDDRIRASLEGANQDRAVPLKKSQPASFWWASSLTGVAAALAIIAVVNLSGSDPEVGITEPPPPSLAMSRIEFNLQPAVLTQTLEQELADFQADLKKAEQVVRDDLRQTGVKALSEEGL